MIALMTLLSWLTRTLLVRLPLGIWLGVLFAGGWLALERQYAPDFPLLPIEMRWPPEPVNSIAPENPSRLPQLDQVIEQAQTLNLGVSREQLAFGEPGHGALLGALFGLCLCLPCGVWLTLRHFSGILLLPFRVIVLAASYVGLAGGLGYLLAEQFGTALISTGYVALFGLAMPIIVPLPFWILRPLFPGEAKRQAARMLRRARSEARTTLADVAKHDPALGNVTKGKAQQEWEYYATVSGIFLSILLAEKRRVAGYRRGAVEKQLRKRLNKLFEKGEHGLTAVSQFCREQLDKGAKYTTEVLVGLWLALQMKGDLNPQRDRDLAISLGGHIVQGMSGAWSPPRRFAGFMKVLILWLGVGGLAYAAMNPAQTEMQLAKLGVKAEPASTTGSDINEPTEQSNPHAADASPESSPFVESKVDPDPAEAAAPSEIPASVPESESPPPKKTPLINPAELETEVAQVTPEVPESDPEESEAASTQKPEAASPETPDNTEPRPREWTHSSGQKFTAVAVSYQAGAVELERADGRNAIVELDKLSQEDCRAVYEQFALDVRATADRSREPYQLFVRTWSDATGTKEVRAALVETTETEYVLLRADGKLFRVSRDKLKPKSDHSQLD